MAEGIAATANGNGKKQMDDHREGICPGCYTIVARFASDRVVVGDLVYHQACPRRLPFMRPQVSIVPRGLAPVAG